MAFSKCASKLILWLLLCVSCALAQKTDFALKSGDRVVFFGDSITEQRLYTSYVQQFVLSRYPDRKITFINSGWGGDTVSANPCVPCAGVGALPRIQRDVIEHKPTVVTLLFGMNDGLYKDFDPAVMKTYTDGISEIIRIIKKETHARIYVMTPTVYDGSRHTSWSHSDKYNDVLDRYSEEAKLIAKRENLPVIDLHSVTAAALNAAKKAQSDYTFEDDGVHPGPDGQAVMAAEILRAWGAPEKGAVVTFNGTGTKNVSIFASLPWPAPVVTSRILAADPLLGSIGSVTLKIKGLAPGEYRLSIDALPAESYSTAQLEAGIPIGTLSKKAQDAAEDLGKAVRNKEDIEFMRWRDVQLRFEKLRATTVAQRGLDELAQEANELARTKAQARKYVITLTPNPDPSGSTK
jgi:lysophospholipase L1-like esterase